MKILMHGGSFFDEDKAEAVRQQFPHHDVTFVKSAGEIGAHIGDADIFAGMPSEADFLKAEKLKWFHSWLAGPNHYLFPALVDSDILFTCSKGNGAVPLAEHAMMLMLLLNRQAMRWINAARERRWEWFIHPELSGLTVGIIGTGNSGVDLALKAKAFHMRTLGMKRSPKPIENFDAMYPIEQLHEFLAQCDFVVMTAPLTAETRGMLDEAAFRAMKPSAYYICFSRGGIADDDALLEALNEGWIAGAGLDAHTREPLPADSPFWTAPNTIITPHNGASTKATHGRGFGYFVENLTRFDRGEPLINVVDKVLGY